MVATLTPLFARRILAISSRRITGASRCLAPLHLS